MGEVKANPETLNDVGNRMLTSSRDLTEAMTSVGEHGTFDASSLGRAGNNSRLPDSFTSVVGEMSGILENLGAVLEADGDHIQRASRDIDEVLNRREP